MIGDPHYQSISHNQITSNGVTNEISDIGVIPPPPMFSSSPCMQSDHVHHHNHHHHQQHPMHLDSVRDVQDETAIPSGLELA